MGHSDFQHGSAHKPPKRVFFAAIIVVFFSTLSAADSVGFVPDYIDGSTSLTTSGSTPLSTGGTAVALASLPQLGEEIVVKGVLPTRINISAVDLDLPVQNPDTRDLEELDAYLKSGPVRYVDSAKLGEKGNVIIFAHSSNLPIVRNKMFQAFNDIPELKAGDTITLTGEDGTGYLYSVESVTQTTVESGASIDLSPSQGKKLTLVTCDTLTGKSARYIVEATYVGII